MCQNGWVRLYNDVQAKLDSENFWISSLNQLVISKQLWFWSEVKTSVISKNSLSGSSLNQVLPLYLFRTL